MNSKISLAKETEFGSKATEWQTVIIKYYFRKMWKLLFPSFIAVLDEKQYRRSCLRLLHVPKTRGQDMY